LEQAWQAVRELQYKVQMRRVGMLKMMIWELRERKQTEVWRKEMARMVQKREKSQVQMFGKVEKKGWSGQVYQCGQQKPCWGLGKPWWGVWECWKAERSEQQQWRVPWKVLLTPMSLALLLMPQKNVQLVTWLQKKKRDQEVKKTYTPS